MILWNLTSLCVIGVIVIVDNNNDKSYRNNSIDSRNTEDTEDTDDIDDKDDIYQKILKNMNQYNLQYNKFSNVTKYKPSSPIPIPYKKNI
jgi:hypothetical protein